MHLEKFIAPGSTVKGTWPRGVSVLSPSPRPYQHCTSRGSKASVRDGHMATGCCGLEEKTEFSLLLSHRADESELLAAWGPHRSRKRPYCERERTEPHALEKCITPACCSTATHLVTLVYLL